MVENGNVDNVQEFMQEQVNKMFELNGTLKLPTIGPMYAFSKDFSSYANDFVTLGKDMVELKSNMDSYWSLVSASLRKGSERDGREGPKAADNKRRF